MESALLNLDVGDTDSETINTIFRAAHSIKGGSATFGLGQVGEFTHGLETLLDQMRDGRRSVDQQAVDLLLRSVDCLREILTALKDSKDFDAERVAEVGKKIEAALGVEDTATPVPPNDVAATEGAASIIAAKGWEISFRPHVHLFRTGNDPVRMFRELESMGALSVVVDTAALPPFANLDPEESYLAWGLTLEGDITKTQVEEVFEWVEGDCDLTIEPMAVDETVELEAAPGVETQAVQEKASTPTAEAENGGLPGSAETVSEHTVVETKHSSPAVTSVAQPVEERQEQRRGDEERRQATKSADSGSIRVGITKVDALINMVGELVITQSMLNQLGEDFDMSRLAKLQEGLTQLERNTRELQESVMQIRMLPISFAFNRFPRMVHDLSQKFGKKVELRLSGEQTELDKTVMEKIGDPLVHLVRNSLDHGLETPEARRELGKPETGLLHLNAYHQGGNIVIEISDDGAGLNKERILAKAIERGLVSEDENLSDERIYELIFQAGFSTAEAVSDISGRGVGMDVVRRNIKDLGGTIDVTSLDGRGTTFTIRLPLTLAILDGQLVRIGEETYIIPLVSIVESLQIRSENVNIITGKSEVYQLRDNYLPIVRLYALFDQVPDNTVLENGLLVVVEGEGQRVGLFVDDLLGQQQVVIKSLETNYQRVEGVSGATILGDGTVALILDIGGLITCSRRHYGNLENTKWASAKRTAAA